MIIITKAIPIQTLTTSISLFDNPLGRMYGPFFLMLYALICLGAILYVRYLLPKRIIRKGEEDHPKIPDQPDPYEIAYLWQSENELLSMVIFNLVRRGYLSLRKDRTQTTVIKNTADSRLLTMMEKDVYEHLEKETSLEAFAKEVYKDSGFRTHTEAMDISLKQQGLLWSVFESEDFRIGKMKVIIALIAVSLYKIAAALSHGHSNIALLIIMTIIASAILMSVQVNKMPSAKGYRLLEKMKQAFRPLHGDQLLKQAPYMEQLILGIYGFGLLAGSEYAGFYGAAVAGLNNQAAVQFAGTLPDAREVVAAAGEDAAGDVVVVADADDQQ